MITFIIRRLLSAVVLLLITSLVTFGIFFLVPRLALRPKWNRTLFLHGIRSHSENDFVYLSLKQYCAQKAQLPNRSRLPPAATSCSAHGPQQVVFR